MPPMHPIRRYMQGTLDFACGIYAVINALSLVYGLNLAGARRIFAECQLELAAHPRTFARYMRNETDHYWLVRYMLRRWCPPGKALPFQGLSVCCPFAGQVPPSDLDLELSMPPLYLPEKHPASGPAGAAQAQAEALSVWQTLQGWYENGAGKRAVILRFHRFVPQVADPIVSHWSCLRGMEHDAAHLHDASSEPTALHSFERVALMPGNGCRALVRIVPESVFLLEAIS